MRMLNFGSMNLDYVYQVDHSENWRMYDEK